MMRTLVAILALSPAVLHAQVKAPAQPSSTPVLRSSLTEPAALSADKPVGTAAAITTPVRVSTGVTPAKLVHSAALNTSEMREYPVDRTVVIDMTVDETGKPTNLKVAQSAGQAVDQSVLQAVSQYRYAPATLDGTPVAFPIHLEYVIQHASLD